MQVKATKEWHLVQYKMTNSPSNHAFLVHHIILFFYRTYQIYVTIFWKVCKTFFTHFSRSPERAKKDFFKLDTNKFQVIQHWNETNLSVDVKSTKPTHVKYNFLNIQCNWLKMTFTQILKTSVTSNNSIQNDLTWTITL